jgi:mono/diheme cytochrome c family protein
MLAFLARRDLAGRGRQWLAMVLLFLASLLSQITGNLLPFDRHGVQTAVVEGSVAKQVPIVGDLASRAILGGDQFGVQTIQVWHFAHIAFCVLGLAGAWLFWRSAGFRKEASRVPVWTPLVIAALMALMVKAPLGQSATGVDFASYNARVSWYTWPMHASLNLFSHLSAGLAWVGSAVIPGLFLACLLFAPAIARRFSTRVVQAVLGGFLAYFLVAIVVIGGGFAPLTGNRDPQDSIPSQVAPIGEADQALVAKGREIFNSLACVSCHGRDGKKPVSGPSLAGIGNRRGGEPGWYMRFIRNPSATKSGSVMPPFPQLSDDELRAIAEFLIHG